MLVIPHTGQPHRPYNAAELVSLQNGARVGPYEVVSLLGAGGMGEVYRARDTKLRREVALKLLPEAFAFDADRRARFEREAHVLASLNHPHIAAIYGLEDGDGTRAVLVMELVDGEDLSQRIARGPIPLEEALPIATQIAEGLEAAHDAGVIHRDLKPANIKLRADGTVKILDFGLAKAVEVGGVSGTNVSMSPTITTPAQMTNTGMILGTAAYMSPEQAKGRPVDKRADVWAFGAVLYEMLTGRRSFEGDDVSDTLAAILRSTPDWAALRPETPTAIRRLLRRCLEKDVRSRLSDMAMVRVELREAERDPPPEVAASTPMVPAAPSRGRWLAPVAAALVAAIATGAVVWRARQPADVPRSIARFSIDLPDQAQITPGGRNPLAISPDGTRLVYAANQRLYMRAIDQLEGTPIPGTEPAAGSLPNGATGAAAPFFSPDGQWIGFWQQGQLHKVSINGGAPVTICEASVAPIGVSWEPDGRIIWGLGPGGIAWVPATGGTAASLITVKPGERISAPQLLPDRSWLLFTANRPGAAIEQNQLVAQSLTTSERRVLVDGVREGQYLSPGHLLFSRGNTVLAQPFDPKTLTVIGGPVPVLESVANAANVTPASYFAVSQSGALFYAPGVTGGTTSSTRLVQVTRDGTRAVLLDVQGMAWFPRFSPEGTRVAYGVSQSPDLGDASDLWVLDVKRGARTRVTFNANNRFYPIWTRDGNRLTHADGTSTTNRLLSTLADGSGGTETLLDVGPRNFPSSWSPDGRVLALYINGPTNTRDLAMLDMTADKKTATPFVATPFEERGAIFSPDGRWIAYVSNKTGQNDIFARPYPGPGAEITISAGGGQEPVWAPSGKELFYRHDGKMLVVRIDETASSLTVGAPARLFDDSFRLDTGGANGGMANYDIAPDGKRFVMIEEPKATNSQGNQLVRVNVVLNWIDDLKRRVPTQ